MITRIIHNALIAPADYIPKKILHIGIKWLGILWDILDKILQQNFELLPPLHIRIQANSNIRVSSYRRYGDCYLTYMKKNCGLHKHGKVLDVGCGSGILVAPLSSYLDRKGLYEGFDLNKQLIEWCQRAITSRYPNFNFRAVNVYNGKYNPKGELAPVNFRFPYANNVFDVVVLSSVFTHMLPGDIVHYLQEIVRVLKKNGFCIISYMLINPVVMKLMKQGKSAVNFKYSFGNYRTINVPRNNATYEDIVAFKENFIKEIYVQRGLAIQKPIHYGYWSGRANTSDLHKQDIIIAKKR